MATVLCAFLFEKSGINLIQIDFISASSQGQGDRLLPNSKARNTRQSKTII